METKLQLLNVELRVFILYRSRDAYTPTDDVIYWEQPLLQHAPLKEMALEHIKTYSKV